MKLINFNPLSKIQIMLQRNAAYTERHSLFHIKCRLCNELSKRNVSGFFMGFVHQLYGRQTFIIGIALHKFTGIFSRFSPQLSIFCNFTSRRLDTGCCFRILIQHVFPRRLSAAVFK